MNRAMFSGVAGLKTHQTKMDVIGNNIANVNTFGYKGQRAVFSDIYYQTIKSASGGTTSRGGTNPSSVGYGSSLAAIQAQMSQSSMQNTGFGLDVAIMGEGFLQVMDADSNIYYTKAGLLDYDSNGYLTDINGNFVLGAQTADGRPGSQKIKLDNIGTVDPQKPISKEVINGIEYKITASNATEYGNVSISIGSSEELPAGLKAVADISPTGAITVKLNAYEKFSSMAELNSVINAAITEKNNGKQHAAGNFTISANENRFGTDSKAGTWTGAAQNLVTQLKPNDPSGLFGGALSISGFDLAELPGTATAADMTLTKKVDAGGVISYALSYQVEGTTYEGTFKADIAPGASIEMKDITNPSSGKKITVKVDDKNKLNQKLSALVNNGDKILDPVTQTPPQQFLGGSEITGVSNAFSGQGDIDFSYTLDPATNMYTITAEAGGKKYSGEVSSVNGGSVTLKTLGDAAVDGTITMKVPSKADMIKNYGIKDILTKLSGGTTNDNFIGGAKVTGVGSAFSGEGGMTFAVTGTPPSGVEVTMGTKKYTGAFTGAGGSITLTEAGGAANDTITMTIPSSADMMTKLGVTPGAPTADADLAAAVALTLGNNSYTVTQGKTADAQLQAALAASLTKHNYVGIPALAGVSTPLTGAEIAGINFGTNPGSVEGADDGAFGGILTFDKTSSNFKGSGEVTGSDFKATYKDNGTDPAEWLISMNIGGVEYTSSVTKDTQASTIMLKGPTGDYMTVSNPGFDGMTAYYKQIHPGTEPLNNATVDALTGGTKLTVTPATPSRDLGLSSVNFALAGGTEGGAITLDQLSSIAIGSDGTVSVSHAQKGTVVAGKISLASFANPGGLQLEGSNYYSESANSGKANLADPGNGGTGALKSSALEMSNVDLSAEFADMITTQRGFQANSRIITVSDTMLEELINLKR